MQKQVCTLTLLIAQLKNILDTISSGSIETNKAILYAYCDLYGVVKSLLSHESYNISTDTIKETLQELRKVYTGKEDLPDLEELEDI